MKPPVYIYIEDTPNDVKQHVGGTNDQASTEFLSFVLLENGDHSDKSEQEVGGVVEQEEVSGYDNQDNKSKSLIQQCWIQPTKTV